MGSYCGGTGGLRPNTVAAALGVYAKNGPAGGGAHRTAEKHLGSQTGALQPSGQVCTLLEPTLEFIFPYYVKMPTEFRGTSQDEFCTALAMYKRT